jgi:hypothetical protein
MDLISEPFDQIAVIIDQLFGRDDKAVKALIDAILQDGCDDVAMIFFLTMALQNYGEFEKAGKIITRTYHSHSSDLLAQCAYADHLMFHYKFDAIPAVFNHTFDFEKVCTKKELPLIIFIHFMSIACTYYLAKNNPRNYAKHLSYLIEAAPEHDETKRHLEGLKQGPPGKS